MIRIERLNPQAALSESALDDACKQMGEFTTAFLLTSSENYFTARRLVREMDRFRDIHPMVMFHPVNVLWPESRWMLISGDTILLGSE